MVLDEESEEPDQDDDVVSLGKYSDDDILTVHDQIRRQKALGTQTYDAFVLFAEDIKNPAEVLMARLKNDYSLKLCEKNDLVVEENSIHEAVTYLISERCYKLVVIISPGLFEDNSNKTYYVDAQKQTVWYRGVNYPKAIPCMLAPCPIPLEISGIYVLNYSRVGEKLFYENLNKNIQPFTRFTSSGPSTSQSSGSRSLSQRLKSWIYSKTSHGNNEEENICSESVSSGSKFSRRNRNIPEIQKKSSGSTKTSSKTPVLTLEHMLRLNDKEGLVKPICYDELTNATNNWSTTVLGKGGFGTVYIGKWRETEVAIKRIEPRAKKGIKQKGRTLEEQYNEQLEQCQRELLWLSVFRHDNILNVYGYGVNGSYSCLVYQYMAGGALDKRLRNKDNVLSWSKRLRIAILTAKGLQFLHTKHAKPLIHGDIKSANILLDLNDEPKIGDFGLAQEGAQMGAPAIILKTAYGTPQYIPLDFAETKQLSTKIDTYSFGVVLFEMATGLKACFGREVLLRYHVVNYRGDVYDLRDKKLDRSFCFESLIGIGNLCVRDKAVDRPEMLEVFKLLENVKQDEKWVIPPHLSFG